MLRLRIAICALLLAGGGVARSTAEEHPSDTIRNRSEYRLVNFESGPYKSMRVYDRRRWKQTGAGSLFTMLGPTTWRERLGTNQEVAFSWQQSDTNFVYLYDYGRSMWLALGDDKASWRVGNSGDFKYIYDGAWQPLLEYQVRISTDFTPLRALIEQDAR